MMEETTRLHQEGDYDPFLGCFSSKRAATLVVEELRRAMVRVDERYRSEKYVQISGKGRHVYIEFPRLHYQWQPESGDEDDIANEFDYVMTQFQDALK